MKTFSESSLKRLVENIDNRVNESKLDYDYDRVNNKLGFKYGTQEEFTYIAPLNGTDGVSITDVYMDDTDGQMVVTLSSDNTSEAVVADKEPITIQTIQSSSVNITLQPNVFYKIGKVSELTFLRGVELDGVYSEYMIQFETADTTPIIIYEDSISWVVVPYFKPNKVYQISILNGIGIAIESDPVAVSGE